MKNKFMTILLPVVCFSSGILAQNTEHSFDEICKAIKKAEANVIQLDKDIIYHTETPVLEFVGLSLPKYHFLKDENTSKTLIKEKLNKYERVAAYIEDTLMPLLGIGADDFELNRMEALLGCITNSATLDWLEYVVNIDIEKEWLLNSHIANSEYTFKKIRSSIRKRLNEIMENEYTFYRVAEAAKKPVKGLYIDHMNDFFFPAYNDDRDMTGSFKIEIFTDWLKMRLFSPFTDLAMNINGRAWYSYQSLVIGGEGYTGYLRDTSRYPTPISVDSTDRPFASTIYFGRAKYRLFNDGFYKVNSLIRFGSIGAGGPGQVQSTLHRDITVGSLRPNGWESQIAAGGRISINYEVTHEKMLLSKGLLLSKKLTRKTNYINKGPEWLNVSLPIELKVGHELTSLSAGLNISNLNFKQNGGINIPFTSKLLVKKNDWWKNHVSINYRYIIRYVFRNPLLEGYGIFKHTPDEDLSSPIDRYVLTGDQVNRWIQIHEFNASVKLKFVAVIVGFKIWSPEFNLPVNSKVYLLSPPNLQIHNSSPWNHVGKLGLLFGFE